LKINPVSKGIRRVCEYFISRYHNTPHGYASLDKESFRDETPETEASIFPLIYVAISSNFSSSFFLTKFQTENAGWKFRAKLVSCCGSTKHEQITLSRLLHHTHIDFRSPSHTSCAGAKTNSRFSFIISHEKCAAFLLSMGKMLTLSGVNENNKRKIESVGGCGNEKKIEDC
jgi:hypothetical protein